MQSASFLFLRVVSLGLKRRMMLGKVGASLDSLRTYSSRTVGGLFSAHFRAAWLRAQLKNREAALYRTKPGFEFARSRRGLTTAIPLPSSQRIRVKLGVKLES